MSTTLGGAVPAGDELVVGPGELFFSTTNQRGIIRSGNSVFVRISGYSETDLTGAPHSLVRHPDMPAGVFALMWDRLLAGQPVAGYVQNRAKDGRSYWVFATATPLGDGFLSVRIAPMTQLYVAARRLYREVRAGELEARRSGLSRPEAAAWGARELEQGLRGIGFDGYQDFMTQSLPAEVAAQPIRGEPLGRSVRLAGTGPVAAILVAAQSLAGQLDALVQRLDAYRELARALSESSRSMLTAASRLNAAAISAREGSALIANRAPVLDNVARVMLGPCHETVDATRSLVAELDSLRDLVAGLRFRIALARVHAGMVVAFATEVIDGAAPAASLAEVPLLCDALHDGVMDVASATGTVNAALASVADAVRMTGDLLASVRKLAGEWRRLALRHLADRELASYTDPIDQLLEDSHAQLAELSALAQRCRAAIYPFDGTALDIQLSLIRAAVSRL